MVQIIKDGLRTNDGIDGNDIDGLLKGSLLGYHLRLQN